MLSHTPRMLIIASLLLPGLALAGPGWEVTSFATTPRDAPRLMAAVNDWMAGPGKTYPGRVILQSHEADGGDPATHSIIVAFDSVAAHEAFGQQVQTDEAMQLKWMDLLDVFTASATQHQTIRGSFVKSWGEVNDTDSVWVVHYLTASDAAAVVAAMERWMNSPTGKQAPTQVHLSSIVAGGIGSPSHVVSVGYASQAEMESWGATLTGNADFSRFMDEIGEVSDYHGANLMVSMASWGGMPLAEVVGR